MKLIMKMNPIGKWPYISSGMKNHVLIMFNET